MTELAHILAESDDFQKFVVMIVVGAIIGIGSLISAAKKKQQEQERLRHRENWDRIQEEMRQRAANAAQILSQQGGYPAYPTPPMPQQAPPVLPLQASYPPAAPPPPPPVFAPTRSIDGPYMPPRPPPGRPASARPMPIPPRAVQVNQPFSRPTQPRRPKKQKPGRLPPAPPMAPAGSASPPAIPTASRAAADAPPTSRTAQPSSSADAAALSRWLTAKTLRSQFILTEILQPPLALRPHTDEAR